MVTRISLLCIAAVSLLSAADTIYFRDGRTAVGSYLGGDSRQVRVVVGDKIQTYAIPDIQRIEFGSTSTSTAAPPAAAPAPERREGLQPSRVANASDYPPPAPQAPPPPGPTGPPVATLAEIPSGTNLVVRMIDTVDSETDQLGKTYRASLDEPVVVGGETVVPRGADIIAKLVDDKQSGKITGSTVLTLDLLSMSVNGRLLDINTEEVSTSSGSRTAKSGKVIGGIAVLGAIIGGIAGGGKGAAVGAVSGAGVGAGVQVLTKGQKVKIPSETRLTFTLQNPVRL